MPTDVLPHEMVAAEIRAVLARIKMPQVRLTQVLDLSEIAVSRRMTGATPLDVNELIAIAGFLGVPACDLLTPAIEKTSA